MAGRTPGRVIIPTNVSELLIIAETIITKHEADGVDSPLHAMQDYKWEIEGPKVPVCTKNHIDAEKAAKSAEKLYRDRDIDLVSITKIVRNTAGLLKSIYPKNPKKLGEYAVEVDDTPRPKKP